MNFLFRWVLKFEKFLVWMVVLNSYLVEKGIDVLMYIVWLFCCYWLDVFGWYFGKLLVFIENFEWILVIFCVKGFIMYDVFLFLICLYNLFCYLMFMVSVIGWYIWVFIFFIKFMLVFFFNCVVLLGLKEVGEFGFKEGLIVLLI